MEWDERSLSPPRKLKLAVIGAGVAGLSAAQWIHKNDRHNRIDLAIYEASNRIGGRIHSCPFGEGFVEKGAAWIHGCSPENPLYDIVVEHKLGQVKDGMWGFDRCELQQRTEHGDAVPISELAQSEHLFNALIEDPRCENAEDFQNGPKSFQTPDHVNCDIPQETSEQAAATPLGGFLYPVLEFHLRQLAEKEGPVKVKEQLRFFQQKVSEEFVANACSTLHDINVDGFLNYVDLPGGHVGLSRGYGSLVERLKSDVPRECLFLNRPVAKIEWMYQSDGHLPVRLHFQDGSTTEADVVLVTASLGFLKHSMDRLFEPRLPAGKRQAIENLGFGVVNKIQLQYNDPFWEPDWKGIHLLWDCDSVDELEGSWSLKNEWFKRIPLIRPAMQSRDVIETLVAGREGEYIESLDTRDVGTIITGVLRKFLANPSIPEPDEVSITRWSSEPYIRGSYTYVAAGATIKDTERLAEPVTATDAEGTTMPRICFAGEATDRQFYSTVHGALTTGRREAERILGIAEALCGKTGQVSAE